jgi:translocation and assembly module TamA
MVKNLIYIVLLFSSGLLFGSSALAVDNIHYEIKGLHGKLLKNATSAIKAAETATLGKHENLDNVQLEQLFYKNEEIIRQSLQPYGYFSPTIQDSIDKTQKPWIFKYQVNPGPSVNISQLKLEIVGPGKDNTSFINLIHHFSLKIGQVFSSEQYTSAKNAL